MAPARCSSASARVVLPAPAWPTRATLRTRSVGNDAMRALLRWAAEVAGGYPTGRASARGGGLGDRRMWRGGERLGWHAGRRPPGDANFCKHPSGGRPMFDGQFRSQAEAQLKPIGANLRKTGIRADHLTILGVVMAAATALAIANGALRLALLLLVLCAVPDVLDGAVAKASGTASPRGAFFDSVCDRVSRRPAVRRHGLVPVVAARRRSHRGPAAGRPRRLADHLLRAGQGRGPRLRRPRRPDGAGRAAHRHRAWPCCSSRR